MPSEKEYKALVVHSGGMDSSLCLKIAIDEYGAENILSLSFSYNQRHSEELNRAQKICRSWHVDHTILDISFLSKITDNALTQKKLTIKSKEENHEKVPNTLVLGRNGLMARVAAIHAYSLKANCIYLGVIEVEEANSGYRDCSRKYMDIIQEALRLDFDDHNFKIKTPIVKMTKEETMELAFKKGVLQELLETTISCYEGIDKEGCGKCPACTLRNEGITKFLKSHKEFEFSYKERILK
jgi:7-cyano-7-deazaguanine synthase